MKKLVKFLLPLISLLFVVNVNASYTINTKSFTVVDNYLSYNSGKTTEDFRDLVLSKLSKHQSLDNYENYIVYIGLGTDGKTVVPRILLANKINFCMNDSNSIPYICFQNGYIMSNGTNLVFNSNFSDIIISSNFSWTDTSISESGSGWIPLYNPVGSIFLASNLSYIQYTTPTWTRADVLFTNSMGSTTYRFGDYIPINKFNYNLNVSNYFGAPPEPTYSYEETILENGNVKLDFTFSDYTTSNSYAFEIENGITNEEYGITNTYSDIFPNQIPFGSNYSIELPFDTYLYITLSKYEQVENTSLYYREELYTHIIDINNIVFENKQDPYFVIYRQNKNFIEGSFANTTSQNTCWYRYSTSQNEDFVPCDELLGLSFYDNGYVEIIIKKGSQIVYSRKINYLGSNQNEPYIKYEVVKQDFYSIVNWSTENYVNNLTFRYSVDNGINFTTWSIYNNNQNYYINVFDNSTIIVEIANIDQTTIYDSKAIIVVNDINTIKNINNTTTNFIDKFKSLFSINGNILNNVSNFYDNIKLSKVYLLIFIPFLTSLIAGIIYLIRRK